MADYIRRERTQRYIEFLVPVWADHGAAYADVETAFAVAGREWEQLHPDRANPPDDWCRVVPGDEHIIIRIEVTDRG